MAMQMEVEAKDLIAVLQEEKHGLSNDLSVLRAAFNKLARELNAAKAELEKLALPRPPADPV